MACPARVRVVGGTRLNPRFSAMCAERTEALSASELLAVVPPRATLPRELVLWHALRSALLLTPCAASPLSRILLRRTSTPCAAPPRVPACICTLPAVRHAASDPSPLFPKRFFPVSQYSLEHASSGACRINTAVLFARGERRRWPRRRWSFLSKRESKRAPWCASALLASCVLSASVRAYFCACACSWRAVRGAVPAHSPPTAFAMQAQPAGHVLASSGVCLASARNMSPPCAVPQPPASHTRPARIID